MTRPSAAIAMKALNAASMEARPSASASINRPAKTGTATSVSVANVMASTMPTTSGLRAAQRLNVNERTLRRTTAPSTRDLAMMMKRARRYPCEENEAIRWNLAGRPEQIPRRVQDLPLEDAYGEVHARCVHRRPPSSLRDNDGERIETSMACFRQA